MGALRVAEHGDFALQPQIVELLKNRTESLPAKSI